MAIQGPNGASLDEIDSFLRREQPHFSSCNDATKASHHLFEFFRKYPGFTDLGERIYAPPDWSADVLGVKNTRLSEEGAPVFRAVAASFSHGILSTEICSKTKLDSRQVSRFIKILSGNKLVYSLPVTLTGAVKDYWGTNTSNIVWATIFLNGRTDEELREDFIEYTRSLGSFEAHAKGPESQRTPTATAVCKYLASTGKEQAYEDILNHFANELDVRSAKARKTLNVQLDTLTTALDKAGVVGSYIKLKDAVVYSRFLAQQSLEFKPLSVVRRENKGSQNVFHMGPISPLKYTPNFLFLTAAQTLMSAHQMLPSVTLRPVDGVASLEANLLLPIVCGDKVSTVTEFLLLKIFQSGEDGIQLSSLRDQCCLARKVMEWISDTLISSFPIVKSEESGTFKYWHFPYGPKALYTPLLESSTKITSESENKRLYEQRIRYGYARIANMLPLDHNSNASLNSNRTLSTNDLTVCEPSHEETPMSTQMTQCASPVLNTCTKPATPVLSPLGGFFSDALECALIQHDAQNNIAMSAKAQLILSFFRFTPLYIQQDLIQLASLFPAEVYASFPLAYGFKDLTKKRTDRKVIQRSIDYLLEIGYILESSVSMGTKTYTVYYRSDIFILDFCNPIESPAAGFLQNTPNLNDRLTAYLSNLPTLLARDEAEGYADFEQDCFTDTVLNSSADFSSGFELSTLSWTTSSLPELANHECTDMSLHVLNTKAKHSDIKISVLAESTRTEQSVAQFSTYTSSCSETIAAIRIDIAQSRRKNNLRRLMILHVVLFQAAKDEPQLAVSDLSLCEALTFSEYAYLFPLPESSPLYHLFLPYLLSFPNVPISKMSNPALYLLVLNNFFIIRMAKYREWLQYMDILHWRIEKPDAKIKNYFHRNISYLPSLQLGDLKKHQTTLSNVLSTLYSSLYISGIGATIRTIHETDIISIELLNPISVSTEQEMILFWSLLEDFSLRMYTALRLITDRGPINLSCLCNELAIYTLMRSWIFNSEAKIFLKERLGDLTFIPTLHSSVSKAQEAAMSLCDSLGQQGVVVHINAFMGAVQKEMQRLFEAESCNYVKNGLQHPITNLLIMDYHKLATIAVNDLPPKYLSLHFDDSPDKALEYYRSSRQSTLNFIMYSMRISTLAFYDAVDESGSSDAFQYGVYIPSFSITSKELDQSILIQCRPDTKHKIHKVQLHQAFMSRASISITYWVDKVLSATRPRGGKSSSLSVNMHPTNGRGIEYCSISLFTNSPWLLKLNTESITAAQIAEVPIFQKYSRDIQQMRAARSSRLTSALQKQRRKQKQEMHLREELALLLSEEAESEGRSTERAHALTVDDLNKMVAQYKASRRYISLDDNDIRYLEYCMMHYMSLFRIVLPWMQGCASGTQANGKEDSVAVLVQEHSNCGLEALIEKYVQTNATRKDFITYGRIHSMVALSLLSPEIDVLIDLPSAKDRRLLLRSFSNTITSIVRNTYREKKLFNPSETVRVANLIYLLKNRIKQSQSQKLQSKLLVEKEILISSMNMSSLKLEFDYQGAADPDCITYVYENSLPDFWPPDLLSICNEIARCSSAYPAVRYDCSYLLSTDQHISLLLQHILSCHIFHHTNPVVKCSTDQGVLRTGYSTHRLLLRRTDHLEKRMLARIGDSIQSLINFLCLPYLYNAIIHSTNVFYRDGSTQVVQYQGLWDMICSLRNKAIHQQHSWASEIRLYMACNLWPLSPTIIVPNESIRQPNELIASNNISNFSLQYLLASGYTRSQMYGYSEDSSSKTLQKHSLVSADSRNQYLNNIDVGTMTVHSAFLLLPSILFGLHRERYHISGNSMEEIRLVDPRTIVDFEFGEEDTSFNPVEDVLDTYVGLSDIVSAMMGDAIQNLRDARSELTCPLVNLTENCNSTLKRDIDVLLQKYDDASLSLTLFNCPEHKDTLLRSGLFVPKRLVTETVFVPLETFLDNTNYKQFATEFSVGVFTDCSIDYTFRNKQEAEISFRQLISLIGLSPGITLERLCTACVPLIPTTVCYLVNILIWDGAIEARRLISLADGYSVQQLVLDILAVDSTEFSRVFLSTNVEHLADGPYNSMMQI